MTYMKDMNLKAIQKIKVSHIKIPSTYHGKDGLYEGDIAVLTLESPIIYRNHIINICLKDNTVTVEENQLPLIGLVAGFGLNEEGTQSNVLKKIFLPIVKFDLCKSLVESSFEAYLIEDKFCAGYHDGTGGVCKGDSGSGFAVRDPITKKYYLYGIVSISVEGCTSHHSALFTKVNYYDNMKPKQLIA